PLPSQTAMPAAAPPAPTPSAPSVLTGTVIGHPPGGPAVVETPAGLLSLPASVPLTAGATVRLEVVAPPQLPPAAAPAPTQTDGLQDRGWPALSEATETLAAADPPAAEQLMRIVPQLGPRLAAGLALFSGALRSGDAKALVGEGGVRGLDKAGRRDLADRLRKDFLSLADEATRPLGDGEWRGLAMPLMAGGAEIDRIHLYVRRPPADDEEGKGKGGGEQRFILEVSLSSLGRLQLDGLVARQSKRFDLIVRTDRPLSDEMRRDIAGIFAESGQLTGTIGQVSFQSGRFVELPPTEAKGTRITV
ncbi:MAG: DNA polymerase III, partial [Actinomycetota bacterium]